VGSTGTCQRHRHLCKMPL